MVGAVLGTGAALAGSLASPTPAGAAGAPLDLLGTIRHPVSGVYLTTGTNEAFSTPAFGDLDGNGADELVVASLDGVVEAHRVGSRTLLWSTDLGRSAIESSPVLVDLSGDGRLDIVVGTMDGRVVWIDGPSGRVVRTWYQLEPLHCPPPQDCRPDGFFATPAVADVNGDGVLDIIAPSWDHTVYAWSSSGPLLWRRYLEDTLWSSPVVADIDHDGAPEIILGGDIWAGNPLLAPEGGLVWILRRDGSTYPGYPRHVPLQTVWSTPAIVDLDQDGNLDVVVGTGTHFPDPGGRWVDAFTARTGRSLPGWPVGVQGRVMTSPAVGDLDGDPAYEVAIASEGGWLYAYDTNGRQLWRSCEAGNPAGCVERYSTHGGVAIADVDDDGAQEVVAALDHELRIHDPRTGAVESSARLSSGLALTPASSPAIAEVGGRTVIAQASFFERSTVVDLFTTDRRLCRADWPTFQQGPRRLGQLRAVPGASGPFRCPGDFVAQQYRDFLGRSHDAAGSDFWKGRLQQGWTGSAVIRSFLGSPEFGKVLAPVVRAHFGVFGTYPRSAAELRSAADTIRRGGTAAQVAQRLAASPSVASLSDDAFVTRVFANLYRRRPTATELARDTGRLAAGTSRGALVAGYSEGSAAARLRAEVNVAMVYLGMLDRVPDAGGWAYWVPATRRSNVDALVTGFQRSDEYRRRVLAPAPRSTPPTAPAPGQADLDPVGRTARPTAAWRTPLTAWMALGW